MDRVPSLETTEQLLAHSAWLTRVARALTTNADDADEVVQQTWLQALARPPVHRRNLRAWLAMLARNFVRSRQRAHATRIAHAAALPRPEPPGSPAESVARAELQQVVLDAVLALAEPYRSTLVQRFLDELSAEEIAKRSGAPVETVRTRVKRGLEQVRARVAERLGGEREQLPALLAPLVGTGAVVMSVTSKLAVAVGVLAAAVAVGSIATIGRGGHAARTEVATSSRPATTAAEQVSATPPVEASRVELASDRADRPDDRPAVDADPDIFDVVGSVVDTKGARVAGATVVLCDRAHVTLDLGSLARLAAGLELLNRDLSAEFILRTETDATGAFRLDRVDAFRPWRIAAWSERDGLAEPRDLTTSSEPIEMRLLGGVGARGVVLDVDSRPKGGPRVFVMAFFERGGGSTSTSLPVDAEGRFFVPPLPGGFHLTAFAHDLLEDGLRSDDVAVDPRDGLGIRDVTLQLKSPPPVRKLRGIVTTADGARLTRDSAWLARFARWELERPVYWTLDVGPVDGTVAPGDPAVITNSATTLNLENGSYELRLPVMRGSTAAPAVTLVLAARGRAVATAPLDLAAIDAADADLEGPTLVIGANVAMPSIRAGALRVRVRDAATGGLFTSKYMQVQSVLRQVDGNLRTAEEPAPDPKTLEALFAPLPPGHCVVTVTCPGYVANWNEAEIEARAEPSETTVTLEHAGRQLRGVVRDADGRPKENARVWWLGREGDCVRRAAFEEVTTRRDGRFLLEQIGAAPGQIVVEAPGFTQARVDVAADHSRAPIVVELVRGVDVSFRWSSPDLTCPNRIRIVSTDGSIAWEDGDRSAVGFRLEWPRHVVVPPGEYRYRVELAGCAAIEGKLDARGSTTVEIAPRR